MIGAHPDDEDTELLTVLVRGLGAEAAYLSLNRGEGGQNLIGPELGPALGLLRTEELLAARRLDGARQYFTRAYDFGYSKSLDETWRHWPRDTVLKDVVRIVRRFRPQVIVSVFSGTPRDGHGQHQAAGWAAREAFARRATPAVSRAGARGGTRALDAAEALPQHVVRHDRHDPDARGRRRSTGRRDSPITRSRWPAEACIARRTWGGSRDWGRPGSGSRCSRIGRGGNATASLRGSTPRHGGARSRVGRLAPGRAAGPCRPGGASSRGGRWRRCRPTAWRISTAPSWRHPASSVTPGATTTRSCPGSGSPSRSNAGTPGRMPHRVTAELRGGRRHPARQRGRDASSSSRAPWCSGPVTATVAADAPLTTPYFHLGAPEPGAVRLERRGAGRAGRAVSARPS